MRYVVYKALDNPPSFVGLKGSYIKYAGIGMGGAGVIGMMIGSITNGLVGVIAFVALAAGVYLSVLAFQAKFSERERTKWLTSRKLQDVIVFEPVSFNTLAARRRSVAEKIVKKKKE